MSIMPRIPILPPDKAPAEVLNVYDDFHKRMAFPAPPNFIMTQGHSLATAKGTWALVRNVLVEGEIPRWTKEMAFVAISKDRGCRYCTAAHIACCRMLGVKPDMLDSLITDPNGIADVKIRDVILFAVKCSKNPQGLLDRDFVQLYEHGFSMSEVMELIAMSALAVYANIIADATCMNPDKIFSEL